MIILLCNSKIVKVFNINREVLILLYPLFEIEPLLILPNKKTLSTLVENCPKNGLQIFNEI